MMPSKLVNGPTHSLPPPPLGDGTQNYSQTQTGMLAMCYVAASMPLNGGTGGVGFDLVVRIVLQLSPQSPIVLL